MRLVDVNKLGLYIPKLISFHEGMAYKDPNTEKSLFISDRIPLTSLMTDYLKIFKLSKKFNRRIYVNKRIKCVGKSYTRNITKLRSICLKSQAIFEISQDGADLYDISYENILNRSIHGPINSFTYLNTMLKDDKFINEEKYNVFWIVSNKNLSLPVLNNEDTRDDSKLDDFHHSSLYLMKSHPKHVLNPETNKNIKNMFIMIPVDTEESKDLINGEFIFFKVYESGHDFNFTRMLAFLESQLKHAEKISKKKLFSIDSQYIGLTDKEVEEYKNTQDNTSEIKQSLISDVDDTINIDLDEDIENPSHNTHKDEKKVTTIKHEITSTKPNSTEHTGISKHATTHPSKGTKHLFLDTTITAESSDHPIQEIDVKTDDKSQLKKSKYDQLKQTYLKENYNDEIVKMYAAGVKNFLPFMEVVKHRIENASDGMTEQDRHIFTVVNSETGSQIDISYLIPRVIEKRFFKIYDKKYILANQVYSSLVNKIKEDTVAFTSSHTKTMIYIQGQLDERIGRYLGKHKTNLNTVNRYVVSENRTVPNSLNVIFKYCTIFKYKNYYISYDLYKADFNLNDIDTNLNSIIIGIRSDMYPSKEILSDPDATHRHLKQLYLKYGKDIFIIYSITKDSINDKPFLIEMKKELGRHDVNIRKMPIPGSSQFARMNISGKKVPVIIVMLIAYLTKNPNRKLADFFAKYFKSAVHIEITGKSINEDNVINLKLSDGYINIFLYDSLVGSELLFSVLRKIDMSQYAIEHLVENNDIQLLLQAYFISQKVSPDTTINAISIGIMSIIDPITQSLIESSDYKYTMVEKTYKPKDIIEILYYCVYLLNDRTNKTGNDFSAYRIRNIETIPAMLYKIASDNSQRTKAEINRKTLNRSRINPLSRLQEKEDILLTEFRNLTTFESFSDLNIAVEVGLISKATYKGFAGLNNTRAVSYDMRAVDPSSIGFIDTGNNVDNQNVGSNRMMPFNPNIKDVRGLKEINTTLRHKVMTNQKLTDEETSSLLSYDTYSEPFLVPHSDAPRISMASIQARHVIPISSYDPLFIKNGSEESLKEIVSSAYAVRAPLEEDKYKVESIDEKKKVIHLISASKKKYAISYDDKVVNNSGGGFHILKEFEPYVKVGQVVKADEALALDKGSFKNGHYTNAKMMHTTFLNMPETFEDGAIISESAAKELVFNYVAEKSILIRKDQTIIKMIDKIGTDIKVDDKLLVFSNSDEDEEELTAIFGKINDELSNDDDINLRTAIKSKYAGKIVDIRIKYNGDSLRKMKPLEDAMKHIPKENVEQIHTNKIAGEYAQNAILITYYILSKIPAMSGSKSTVQSTKSVFIVRPDEDMPKTLDGKRIDYVLSTFSIITRMTINNFMTLYTGKIVKELRDQLKKDISKK